MEAITVFARCPNCGVVERLDYDKEGFDSLCCAEGDIEPGTTFTSYFPCYPCDEKDIERGITPFGYDCDEHYL